MGSLTCRYSNRNFASRATALRHALSGGKDTGAHAFFACSRIHPFAFASLLSLPPSIANLNAFGPRPPMSVPPDHHLIRRQHRTNFLVSSEEIHAPKHGRPPLLRPSLQPHNLALPRHSSREPNLGLVDTLGWFGPKARIEENPHLSRLVSLSSHRRCITFLRDSSPSPHLNNPTGRRMPSTLSFVPVAVPVLGWLLATILIFVVHFLACWRRRAHLVGHLPQVSKAPESEAGGRERER